MAVLNLETGPSVYFVVVNEACIPVTQTCFQELDLHRLKLRFRHVECFREDYFVYIRYKMGLMYKKYPERTCGSHPKIFCIGADNY